MIMDQKLLSNIMESICDAGADELNELASNLHRNEEVMSYMVAAVRHMAGIKTAHDMVSTIGASFQVGFEAGMRYGELTKTGVLDK